MRVLLIEDNNETATLICAGLGARDHQMTLAPDGASALAAAGHAQFDVIVVDRMLPDTEGMALIAALRAAGQRGAVLLLTALGSEEDRVAGFAAGADDYLVKPFSMAELAARVGVLGRRNAGGPTVSPSPTLPLTGFRAAFPARMASSTFNPAVTRHRDGIAAIVSDDGPGVDRNAIPRLAEPFFRIERARLLPGAGIGLAIVAAIARLHGARLEILGKSPGLVVGLYFPMVLGGPIGGAERRG